jgi:Lrp/AsnC family leucine-responsive transcriptional regulator
MHVPPPADPASTSPPSPPAPAADLDDLDDLDRRILAVLQDDASLSHVALAARVHASAPTCLRRVRRLVERGVIERRVAIVAPDALGPSLTAIVEVTLDRQASELLDAFQARAVAEPAVQQCYRVSPGPDFVLVLQVRDMAADRAFAHRVLASESNVRNVRTYFSVLRAKFETRVAV